MKHHPSSTTSLPAKRSNLPANMTTEQLGKNGFELVSPILAKHYNYRSFRHMCSLCSIWFMRGYGTPSLCKTCFVKTNLS